METSCLDDPGTLHPTKSRGFPHPRMGWSLDENHYYLGEYPKILNLLRNTISTRKLPVSFLHLNNTPPILEVLLRQGSSWKVVPRWSIKTMLRVISPCSFGCHRNNQNWYRQHLKFVQCDITPHTLTCHDIFIACIKLYKIIIGHYMGFHMLIPLLLPASCMILH